MKFDKWLDTFVEEKVKEFHEKIDLFKNLVLYTHAKEEKTDGK